MNNANQPIHPSSIKESYDLMGHEMFRTVNNKDLTKREYFAGLFIQGILSAQTEMRANRNRNDYFGGEVESLVTEALNFTDELLKQLEK